MLNHILVTGASGQLGSEIIRIAGQFKADIIFFTDFPEVDITNVVTLRQFIVDHQISVVINCAAYTAVDQAEEESDQAAGVNTLGPEIISLLAAVFGIRFIHISTDYVFDGENCRPYMEDDIPNPSGVYGKTKLEGEKAILAKCPEAIIIRTSWLYSSFGKNFVKTMLRLMDERSEIGVVADQVGTPTYAGDLALAILALINEPDWSGKTGIYHFSNEGVASWFDFAMAIREVAGRTCRINPLTSDQFPTPARRPAYSVLDKAKIKKTFSLEVPYWRDSLRYCLGIILKEQQVESFKERQASLRLKSF
jgi:dTDP-4-dehydrorhamnose reductase